MRKIILAVLAVSALAAISATPAEAWGGCGPYRHPTPWGCRWNGGWAHPGWYGGGWRWRHPGWYGGGWRWHHWHHYY